MFGQNLVQSRPDHDKMAPTGKWFPFDKERKMASRIVTVAVSVVYFALTLAAVGAALGG